MRSFFLLISLIVSLFGPVCVLADESTEPVVADSWLNAAMENIEKKEYEPSLQELDYRGESFAHPKYHLANRANNLRAYFDENGMELMERVIAEEENWNLKIKSIEVKGGKDGKILSDLDVAIEGNNIVCVGDGIEVVYSNSKNGIQQSIYIRQGIKAERIDFIIEAENLNISSEGEKFILTSKESEIIYQIERIEDADGEEVSYSLSNVKDKLNISLDNKDVVYPINITTNVFTVNLSASTSAENAGVSNSVKVRGLSETPDWTAESDQGGATFGFSVSTAGDVNGDGYSDVIVGAPFYYGGEAQEGRAFLYHGNPGGLSASPDWTVEADKDSAWSGYSVSTAGDVNGDGYSDVIVGSAYYDNGQVHEGMAFVYHGSPAGLSSSPDWAAESNMEDAYFGHFVATAGDVNGDGYSDVIVGAPGYTDGQLYEGAAFVYHGSSGGLSGSPDWSAESNQGEAYFGADVSGAGDVNGDGYSDVIVGARLYDSGEEDGGMAFVYHGSSGGLSLSHDWSAECDQAYAAFGESVSGAGDVNGDGYSDVIVGARMYSNGQDYEGGAFVYHGGSGGLSTSPDWSAEGDNEGANFGYSVAGAGDVNGDGYSDVIVGACLYNNGQVGEGMAFVYHGSSGGLSSSADWSAESNQQLARFGTSVSTAGDVNGDGYADVIVGAERYSNGEQWEGMAFVYHGSSEGLSEWTAESNQEGAYLGYSVSTAGDINGDGYSDVIVGAYQYDNGQTNEGAAFAYNGSSFGLSGASSWNVESDQGSAYLGYTVSTAGDVNGDGYSDVIVGSVSYDNGELNEGAAFVYHGSSGGLSVSPDWTAESDQVNGYFGQSVSSAGDVNGDGYSDVIVGAYQYDNGEEDEGRAFVYHGGSGGLSSVPNWTAESNQEGGTFGWSVAGAGDINGDGYSDVIVGAYHYSNGEENEGRAFVYNGSSAGLSSSFDWMAESNQENADFGYSVSTAGDINGDGYSDVIVGARYYDNGEANEGAAFVYNGSSSGLSGSSGWTAESDQEGGLFGWSVSSAGDVNGDGYSDVVIGAYRYDHGEADEGAAFIYHGSSSGLFSQSDTTEVNQANAFFGASVSTAGDVNGDGYSDVIVGAPNYYAGQTNEGRAFLYYGNERGQTFTPTQSTSDGSHPVQLGNLTGTSGVRLNMVGKTPGGRGRVKLQWEVKELGQLFDGTSISESASWYDTGVDGVEISEDVTGLGEGKAYHWRARLMYDPVYYEGSLYSRWLSIGPNGWNETDFITTDLSGIEDNSGEIVNLQLSIFPAVSTNIFSISFSVSEEEAKEDINLKVYNKAGIMVKSLFQGKKPAGTHTINLNGNTLPNDIYFVTLKKGKKEQIVRKVVLLR